MKDYSLNYDDSKNFILSYKIENEKIVAKLDAKDNAKYQNYLNHYKKEINSINQALDEQQ